MQVLQDNFFYQSNSRFGGGGVLEDERQLFVVEQKLCKARARKFSQETNRRRKALEERRKQWDVQEQRLRENILQQRRQRVQDATERFQRAHLPPSQRRRQSFRRNVPNIEDALSQLQGSLSSYTRQSSFLCSTSNISRSCTPSPKPPTVPKSSHRQALSAVEAYTKLLQEQSMTGFKNSQDTGNAQEKLQDHSPRSKRNPEDHQLSLTTVSGASKPGPSVTPPASIGYHFTKQAWADVGVQVSLPQERADEVKVPRSNTRTGGPKVPWRERSARAGMGPVSSRTRKGTVIRPQSATEVNQIAKAQGKMMVPCPPPRIESVDERTLHITKTLYGMDHVSVNCKQAPAIEQALHKDTSEGFFSPYTHHPLRTDSSVMYTPMPPSCVCPVSEGNTKGAPSSGHQETQGSSRRRGMVFSEKGLRLDCTPTDEEISQLWHGVRSALATKDGNVMKHLSEPVRMFSSACNGAFTDEALESAAQLHLAEVHSEGPLEERDIVAAMETAQIQGPGTGQQRSQQQGLTNISLEEQKILLSLDRLNHQLHYKGNERDEPSQTPCIFSQQPLSI
ncbi:hypothetical protein INR49_021336 [Caranx melampygus]|nr:hypothetical protein INR49_021336 [Caranx melampygus]